MHTMSYGPCTPCVANKSFTVTVMVSSIGFTLSTVSGGYTVLEI